MGRSGGEIQAIIVSRDDTFVNARGYDGNSIIQKTVYRNRPINLGVFATTEMAVYDRIWRAA